MCAAHGGEGAAGTAPATSLADELKRQTGRDLELIFPPNIIKKVKLCKQNPSFTKWEHGTGGESRNISGREPGSRD